MKRDAFTLVEILVVIAVIALLLMIIMPTYQHAAALTRATLCRNNLAKLSTAFATHGYATAGGVKASTLKDLVTLPHSDTWPGVLFDNEDCPAPLFICPEKSDSTFSIAKKPNPLEGLRFTNSGSGPWINQRGWDIPFTEEGRRVGIDPCLYFGTRRGKDSRGDYIEVGIDDNVAVTASYMDNDGHDGLLRVYLEPNGNVSIKLMKFSCGENQCVLYFGKALFPDTITDPTDPYYGWLGPRPTSKIGLEVPLKKGMQCSYGINERSGDLRYGDSRVLLVDYDKAVVNLSSSEFPKLMSDAAKRHLGKVNILLTDGAVRATGPTQLDPLLGGKKLWEP